MRVERLVESRPALVALSADEASALSAVGARLASETTRTVIDCQPYGPDRWRLAVASAVGVVSVPGLRIVVEPKIPLPHLLHLFARSGEFPRVEGAPAELEAAESLWPLVATWYLGALERLLRAGLSNGYRELVDQLPTARGRVDAPATARLVLQARPRLACRFEEFDLDTPVNRVLRAAAAGVARSDLLPDGLRRRARRSMHQLEGVGPLQPGDLRQVWPERHTARYTVPLQLARHVLDATGRGVDVGAEQGQAFLIPTPAMVEEAIRRIARAALAGAAPVEQRTHYLAGAACSLTPDLVFGARAVGDVKYKLWAGQWDRDDLYQLVAFAAGFEVADALALAFRSGAPAPARVQVGRFRLSRCDWTTGPDIGPDEAENNFSARLQEWWAGLTPATG